MFKFVMLKFFIFVALTLSHSFCIAGTPGGTTDRDKIEGDVMQTKAGHNESSVTIEDNYTDKGSANYESDIPGKYFTLILSSLILLFGFLILVLEVWIILSSKSGMDAFAFKIISLTLIITGALFLMTAGYTEDQLTPIIGLLGTVAGYILGQEGKQKV